MPIKICRNCGAKTNTAVCDWIDSKDDKADKCYAKFEDGKWVKGCGYDDCDPTYTKPIIDKIINNNIIYEGHYKAIYNKSDESL